MNESFFPQRYADEYVAIVHIAGLELLKYLVTKSSIVRVSFRDDFIRILSIYRLYPREKVDELQLNLFLLFQQ